MANELSKWFEESYKSLEHIIGDKGIVERMIQYDFFQAVWSCMGGDDEKEWGEYYEGLLESLFVSLGTEVKFNAECWNAFYNDAEQYREFKEKYSLPDHFHIREIGIFWTKFIDRLDDEPVPVKLRILCQLIKYKNWFGSYCKVYTYQYWVDHPCPLIFNTRQLSPLQFWEYCEVESFLNKIVDLPIDDRIEKLNRRCCEDDFEERFPDRETLFLDFVEKGISIPEAIQITKRIRTGGYRLTDSMQEKLKSVGYSDELVPRMKNYGYVKSRAGAVIRLLFISNLQERKSD